MPVFDRPPCTRHDRLPFIGGLSQRRRARVASIVAPFAAAMLSMFARLSSPAAIAAALLRCFEVAVHRFGSLLFFDLISPMRLHPFVRHAQPHLLAVEDPALTKPELSHGACTEHWKINLYMGSRKSFSKTSRKRARGFSVSVVSRVNSETLSQFVWTHIGGV